jgi:radical SAM superfamily enzyme YgiQ (UPF0313 family)
MSLPPHKRTVRMLALNLSERDLSIGLVMLKEFALEDERVRDNYDIHLHQWMKDYGNMSSKGTLEGLDLEALLDELDPENTDVYGFSMYIWNQTFMLTLAEELKKRNPNVVLLFGGSQAGGYGSLLLEKWAFADYVIKGEAEYSFRLFLLGLLDDDLSEVPNLFWRGEDGSVGTNVPLDRKAAKKMSYVPSIEQLPMPYKSQEYRDYLDNVPYKVTAQFETERGCPLSCAFCSWGTTLPIRRRHREDVEEGLLYLINHPNVKAVYVVDANPFINQKKGLWLSEFVLKHRTGKPVFFEVNPEYIRDERVIENLGKLQGDELAFGLQSTNANTLKRIKRKFHQDVYVRNVKRLRELNPDANIKFSVIVGLPGDNLETFTGSLDFVISMRPTDVYVHDLLILPGSEMWDDPDQFDIVIDREPPHRLLHNKSFPWEDQYQAKQLGLWVKLLHNLTDVRDALFEAKERSSQTYVELYAQFVQVLEAEGVDPLWGAFIGDVSSERFDHLKNEFVNDVAMTSKVRDLLQSFLSRRLDLRRTA